MTGESKRTQTAVATRNGLQAGAQQLPSAPLEFIANPEFVDAEHEPVWPTQIRQLTDPTATNTPPTPTDASPPSGHAPELHALELLTAEQERMLFRHMNLMKYRAQQLQAKLDSQLATGSQADLCDELLATAQSCRQRLVESNTRLVQAIARRLATSHHQFEEYFSDGLMILLKCIDKFDFARGYRFSTYATHSIQRHIYRLSRTSRKRSDRFCTTPNDWLAELAQAGSDSPSDKRQQADECYRTLMSSAGNLLDEREQTILDSRFGLGSGVSRSLREVGAELGLSKERVRQLQIAAVEKLQHLAGDLCLSLATL